MIGVTKTFIPSKDSFSEYLDKIWETGWVTSNGQLVRELSHSLKEYLGVPYINLLSSGTLGLQVAVKALDLEGEVITTAFSYVATTSSIVWLSLKPVFVDIDPESLNIDPSKIEAAIGPDTRAILATHVFGNPCDTDAIEAIANRHGLKVIYDAAAAFGVKYKERSLLNFGDLAVLSFHATKIFHTAEGGAIISHEQTLADKISQITNFGHKGDDQGFEGLGINGKLSELHAAMGLSVLPHVKELIEKRKEVCNLYEQQLSAIKGLRRQKLSAKTEYNYTYFPLIFRTEELAVQIKSKLKAMGYHARRYFYPALSRLPYVDTLPMPIAEDISKRILCLPLSHEMTESQVVEITSVIT